MLLLGLLDSVLGTGAPGLLAAGPRRPPPSTPAVGPVCPTQRWETSPEKKRGLLEAELGLRPLPCGSQALPRPPGVRVSCSDKGKTEATAAEAWASSQDRTCPGSGPFPTRSAVTLNHGFPCTPEGGWPSTCYLPCPPRRSPCRLQASPLSAPALPPNVWWPPLCRGYPCFSPSPGHLLLPKLKVALKPCLTVPSTVDSNTAHPRPPQWGGKAPSQDAASTCQWGSLYPSAH